MTSQVADLEAAEIRKSSQQELPGSLIGQLLIVFGIVLAGI